MMQKDFTQEQRYLKAKKRVKDIKGFYIHAFVYVIINIVISVVIATILLKNSNSFSRVIVNFGVYSTWLFWGIGLFFHWLGVFGFKSLGFGQDWEEKKIKEIMEKENNLKNKGLNK